MENEKAVVPIADALPELRAEQYAKVREWDAARMALEGEYEHADGEYLVKIRNTLKVAGHGLWTRYLRARGIPEQTAYRRIQVAEGRFVRPKPISDIGLRSPSVIAPPEPAPSLPAPAPSSPRPEYVPYGWPTMGVGEDPDEEEEEENGEEIAAYMPPPPQPTPIPFEHPGVRQWADRVDEAFSNTPQARAEALTSFMVKLGAYHRIDDEVVAAWLECTSTPGKAAGRDTLAAVIQWAKHTLMLIDRHESAGLRIVSAD